MTTDILSNKDCMVQTLKVTDFVMYDDMNNTFLHFPDNSGIRKCYDSKD